LSSSSSPDTVDDDPAVEDVGDWGSARSGRSQAGDDSPTVRPITPGNVVPGSYALIAIVDPPGGGDHDGSAGACLDTKAADSVAVLLLDARAAPRHTLSRFYERL